jgi:D-glycero-alpha-D-manno-heptose-7-phosphate kinase
MAIITAISPCRIGIVGGGSDIEPFASTFGGATVSLAINIRQKFTLLTGKDMFSVKEHQVPNGCSLDFVYAFREHFGVDGMHHNRFISESDGGINSGIGSSAAISVAIVGALAKSEGKTMTRSEIAELAWDIEVNKLKMFGGRQDQYAASYGGLNLFEFTKDGVLVQPFDRKYADNIMPHLVLMHTGKDRTNSKIQEGFKKLDSKQIKALKEIKSLVAPTIEAIGQGDIQILGEILDTAWNFKKQSNKEVTNPRISDIYQTAKKHGAIGGKCVGAGGGGYMVFIVKDKQKFVKEMKDLEYWDISCDFNGVEIREGF